MSDAREQGPADVPREPLRIPTWLRPESPVPTFVGIGVSLLGFVLILVAWGQVAGESQVFLQIPYVLSGGLTGIALVMSGLTIVNVAAKRQDAAARDRQNAQLMSLLSELESAVSEPAAARRPGQSRR